MNETAQVPLITSFVAGILTFVSPCVLPLIPAYITYITGSSLDALQADRHLFRHTFLKAVFFVLGFSAVFVLLGASASFLGGLVSEHKVLLRYVGGALVVVFGLHLSGLIRIPLLYREAHLGTGGGALRHTIGPFLVGFAFAVGWTPCVGPILASILILASTQETVGQGVLMLSVYSLGLGIPFILTAVFIDRALRLFTRIKKHYRAIEIAAGVILIIVGILIITDSFKIVGGYLSGFIGV